MLPDPLRAREMIPHQPFYLRAMAQTLQILEDPDFRIIEEGKFCFVNGVEVGHTGPLGPVPQVFRARRKDQRYDDSIWQPLMENYRDGPDVCKSLEEAFAKEEAEGRMFPLSFAEARSRYPGDTLRIAAQAVIPKPDHDFRVVHDGTHGVQVNNQIVMLDRLESPGAREVSAIQKLGMVSDEKVLFGLVGDVKKAHRRFLHHPEHWGVLACRAQSDSSVVWINRTGTFGIASAAYWFARIIGLVGRLSLRLSGSCSKLLFSCLSTPMICMFSAAARIDGSTFGCLWHSFACREPLSLSASGVGVSNSIGLAIGSITAVLSLGFLKRDASGSFVASRPWSLESGSWT